MKNHIIIKTPGLRGLPYWRYVVYLDDGVARHQCLTCKDYIETYSLYGWRFCPMCGVRWAGELKWDMAARDKRKGYDRPRQRFMPGGAYWVEEQHEEVKGVIHANRWRHHGDIMYGDPRDYSRQHYTSKDRLRWWKEYQTPNAFRTVHYRLMYRAPGGEARVIFTHVVPPVLMERLS